MARRVLLAAASISSVAAVCEDTPGFTDENGNTCSTYVGIRCVDYEDLATDEGLEAVLINCAATCGTCVKANDYCEVGQGGDVVAPDMTNTSNFEFVDQELLTSECEWIADEQGLRQTTNAWGNDPGDNTLMGCMALIPDVTYTDFIMEVDMINDDNDGVGFVFGVQNFQTYHQAHMINDRWPDPPADFVPGPHLKIKVRNDKECLAYMTNATNCHNLLGYTAALGSSGQTEEEYPNGQLSSIDYFPEGYHDTYDPFGETETHTTHMTLVVHNGEARIRFNSQRNNLVATWSDLGDRYVGGQVGLFTYAHQVYFSNLKVVDLSDSATPMDHLCENEFATCDTTIGLCVGGPTATPTAAPTFSPTGDYDGEPVAAADYCPGPVGGDVLEVDTTSLDAFTLVEHPLLSETCEWTATADGITQQTNAWGNYPGDNTLMGCLALVTSVEYTDFIAEVDSTHRDNDGWGFVFGYNAIDDHYLAITINDIWPSPAADDIGGPFVKIKKHNGREVQEYLDGTNNCWDTITHIDANGFNVTTMTDVPLEYEIKYPYTVGEDFQDTTMTLIVKDGEVRVLYPSPYEDLGTVINNIRQGNRYVGTWTKKLPLGYQGGQIGVFTYAHQVTFSNFKITDLSEGATPIESFCGGHPDSFCDVGRTGLCHAVPIPDVCQDAVGAKVFDTTTLDTFELIDDPYLGEPCEWIVEDGGHIRQISNANRAGTDYTLMGCNALLEPEYTDFIMQVRMDHRDNDGIGFDFGWKSLEDHFRIHKVNDRWPSPAADTVGGPALKIKRRNGRSCEPQPMDHTNICYDTVAFIDQYGAFHREMPAYSVQPAEYSNVYLPYDELDHTIMILIVRDNQLRVMFKSPEGERIVSAFAFDLSAYNYTGGRVGLFTFAHQAQFSELTVGELSGDNAVTEFCDGTGTCNSRTGLCDSTGGGGGSGSGGGDKKKKSSGSSTAIIAVVVVVCVVVAIILFVIGVYYGRKVQNRSVAKNTVEAVPTNEVEMDERKENDPAYLKSQQII